MTPEILFILLISFVATLVRSTFGFGESLVAVPLFLLFLPAETAVPLSVLLSVVVALIVVVQDHKKIHLKSAKWLIIFTIPGIPLGIFILVYGNEMLIKVALAIFIIGYSLYSLFAKKVRTLPKDSLLWLFICGFSSGVFGGAYGLNGPPLVIYGNMRRWSAPHFRATLQAYFLPASLIGIIGYIAKGLINSQVYTYFFLALTTAVPAVFLGRFLNRKLKDQSFFRYVYFGLIIVGIVLIGSTFAGS